MAKPVLGDPDIAQAAEELNVSPQFIRYRIADKSLDAYRIKGSRLIRVRRESLEAMKVAV
jgi:excisionase family DNA binding protein